MLRGFVRDRLARLVINTLLPKVQRMAKLAASVKSLATGLAIGIAFAIVHVFAG